MLDRINNGLNRISNRRNFLVLLIAVLSILVTVNFVDLPWTLPAFKRMTGGSGILDLEFHYTAEKAYRMIETYGSEGRKFYLLSLWSTDVIIPVVFFLFLAVAITLGWKQTAGRSTWLRYLNLFPLLAGLFDYAENVSITVLLVMYPQRLEGLANFAGYLTTTKHVLYQSALLVAIAGGVLLARRRWVFSCRSRTANPAKTENTISM